MSISRIRRVNGKSIERPDDLSLLWQALRGAAAIELDVRREGQDELVSVPIRD